VAGEFRDGHSLAKEGCNVVNPRLEIVAGSDDIFVIAAEGNVVQPTELAAWQVGLDDKWNMPNEVEEEAIVRAQLPLFSSCISVPDPGYSILAGRGDQLSIMADGPRPSL